MILPIALVVVVGVRYLLWMLKIFNEEELKHLDDVLPDFTRHAHLDDEDKAICIDSNNKEGKIMLALIRKAIDHDDVQSERLLSAGFLAQILQEHRALCGGM